MVTTHPAIVPIGFKGKGRIEPETDVGSAVHPALNLMVGVEVRDESCHCGVPTVVVCGRREAAATDQRVDSGALIIELRRGCDDVTRICYLGAFQISEAGRIKEHSASVISRGGV